MPSSGAGRLSRARNSAGTSRRCQTRASCVAYFGSSSRKCFVSTSKQVPFSLAESGLTQDRNSIQLPQRLSSWLAFMQICQARRLPVATLSRRNDLIAMGPTLEISVFEILNRLETRTGIGFQGRSHESESRSRIRDSGNPTSPFLFPRALSVPHKGDPSRFSFVFITASICVHRRLLIVLVFGRYCRSCASTCRSWR